MAKQLIQRQNTPLSVHKWWGAKELVWIAFWHLLTDGFSKTSSSVSHLVTGQWTNARGAPWFLPSTSLEYFFSQPLLHSQAKSRLKSGVGWSGKIYENWTAFQCFSPHVMLISSSKGSWLNFLFRNRRIFSIETFVIYKLGRLSALPLQQASRWKCTSAQRSAMYCNVFW